MDWKTQLTETQDKQPIKLKPFIEKCCTGLDTKPNEITAGLLSKTDITDILNGDIPKVTLVAHIKVWILDGKHKINEVTNIL